MTTHTSPRTFRVSLVTSRGLVDYGTAQATDAADAVRAAHDLGRRPSLRHDGPNGSGYVVRGRYYVAVEVGGPELGRCEVCGGSHEVTAQDRIGDRGERVSDAEAMAVAHYRLAILATSSQPFALHGGRAA